MKIKDYSQDFMVTIVESPVNQVRDQIIVEGVRIFRRINFSQELAAWKRSVIIM